MNENYPELFSKLVPSEPFEGSTAIEKSVYRTAYMAGRNAIKNVFLGEELNNIRVERDEWFFRATHDELTGLLNRSGLSEELNRLKLKDIACLTIDGTNVKAINDKLGHIEGDKAIIGMARVLSQSTRGCDLVARVGGDEFVVIVNLAKRDETSNLTYEDQINSVKERINTETTNFLQSNPSFADLGLEIAVGSSFYSPEKGWRAMIEEAESSMRDHKDEQHERLGVYRPSSS